MSSYRFIVESRNSNNRTNVDLQNREDAVQVGLSTGFRSLFIKPEIRFSKANKKILTEYSIDYGIYHPGMGLYLAQFSYIKTHFPFYAMGVYAGEGFGITNYTPYYLLSTKIGLNLIPDGSTFDIEYFKNIQVDNKFDSSFGYTDKPEIEMFNLTHNHNSKDFILRTGFTRLTGRWRIILLYENLPFSTITFPTVSYSALASELKLKNTRFTPSIFFNYYYFRIDGAGNIQSWPFTSVITNVVANRMNFRIDGWLNAINLGGKLTLPLGGFHISPELQFYHIIPESEIDTWQPEYLVFGVRNFYDSYDEIKNAGLARLRVFTDWKLEDYSISAELSQFIPLYLTKEIKKKRPPGYIKPEQGQGTITGGTEIQIKISREF